MEMLISVVFFEIFFWLKSLSMMFFMMYMFFLMLVFMVLCRLEVLFLWMRVWMVRLDIMIL